MQSAALAYMTSFAHLTTFELSIQLSPRIWQYLMLLRFYGKSDIKDYYSWWLVCGGTSHKRRSPCGLRLLPLFRVMTFGASSRQDLFYRRTAPPFALYLASVAPLHKNSFPKKDFLWVLLVCEYDCRIGYLFQKWLCGLMYSNSCNASVYDFPCALCHSV